MASEDVLVVLHHLPLSLLCGAVGRAVNRSDTQLFIELLSPAAAVAAHPRVKVDLENASVFVPTPLKEGLDAAMLHAVTRGIAQQLVDAVHADQFPSEEQERVWGIEMSAGQASLVLGSLVYHCWAALVKGGVTVEELTEALLQGTLPHFFETRLRALAAVMVPQNSYVAQVCALKDLSGINWNVGMLAHTGRFATQLRVLTH